MTWAGKVIEAYDLRPSERVLAMILGNRRNNDTGLCNPSIARLAEDTRYTERQVYRARDRLRELGVLTWPENNGGRNRRCVYTLIDPPGNPDINPDMESGNPDTHVTKTLTPMSPAYNWKRTGSEVRNPDMEVGPSPPLDAPAPPNQEHPHSLRANREQSSRHVAIDTKALRDALDELHYQRKEIGAAIYQRLWTVAADAAEEAAATLEALSR
jgi:hypothetical protein